MLETNEDWDLWLQLMSHTHFATVREPTHFYFAEAGTSGTHGVDGFHVSTR